MDKIPATPIVSNPDLLIKQVELARRNASRRLRAHRRSELGQFFTPAPVARLMASMFAVRAPAFDLLDAGAGVGSLCAAVVAELCHRERRPQTITVTAYEIEPLLIDYLRTTLDKCAEVCQGVGIRFKYEIIQKDFITAAVAMLQSEGSSLAHQRRYFTGAILNPPYRKINSNSDIRRLLRTVGVETSNLYAAFMWLVSRLIKPDGEMVAIAPRSFCNGPYFRNFRVALLESVSFRKVHIFDTRDQVFQDDDVLQENIIVHMVNSLDRRRSVLISSSAGPDDKLPKIRRIPHEQLVQSDNPDAFIYIVPDELGYKIWQHMRGFEKSLDKLGLSVSTGRVVDFRCEDLLRQRPSRGTVPLIYPGDFSNGFVAWPRSDSKKPVALLRKSSAEGLLVPAGYYVLVKRFSSKEEKRRVVAAIYDPERIPAKQVGFENHLNYFHQNGQGLEPAIAIGMTVFLNSTLVDQYFRQFNGHTQVNATDLRSMKYPAIENLKALGARIGKGFPEQDELDRIVTEELDITPNGSKAFDPILAKKKIDEATTILKALNPPRELQNDRSALTLLALLGMKANTSWRKAVSPLRSITEVIDHTRNCFGVIYAANTHRTFQRFTIPQFVRAGLVLKGKNKSRSMKNFQAYYQIEPSLLKLIQTYGSKTWQMNLATYLRSTEAIIQGLHRDSE